MVDGNIEPGAMMIVRLKDRTLDNTLRRKASYHGYFRS
jgi:hypothetical protein